MRRVSDPAPFSMLEALSNNVKREATLDAAASRVATCVCTFGALVGMVFLGWNYGPATHVGLNPVTLVEACGYAALVCVLRHTVRPRLRPLPSESR